MTHLALLCLGNPRLLLADSKLARVELNAEITSKLSN